MHGGNRRRVKFLLIPCYGSAPVVGVIRNLPDEEWVVECAPGRIAQMLNDIAKAVRDKVKSSVEAGRDMNLHYDSLNIPGGFELYLPRIVQYLSENPVGDAGA
jgi:hypothetical protein